MSSSLLRSSNPQVSDLFLKFLVYIFQGKLPRLESFPNCGRVGNPQHVECIWDCEWISNTLVGEIPNTGPILLDLALSQFDLRYSLIKYPQDKSCLDDCTIIDKLQDAEDSVNDLVQIAIEAISQRSNIDSIVIEICVLYFELDLPPCFKKPPFRRNLETETNLERLVGNSLTNSYTDPTLNYTLNQYPWTCSLRTAGYRVVTSTEPPCFRHHLPKHSLGGAAHCNYIGKSCEGTSIDLDDNLHLVE